MRVWRREDEVKDEIDHCFSDSYLNTDSFNRYNGVSLRKIPDKRDREDIRDQRDDGESVEFGYGDVKAYGEGI